MRPGHREPTLAPQRHPLNRDFTGSVPPGPYRTASEEQVREYDRSGFFVHEDAFDREEVGRLTAAIDPLEADAEAWLRREPDARALPLRAGSIAVFSSLTPHRTGPNLGQAVRKAYIVQYAPDGASVRRMGQAPQRCDDPRRRYPVLVGSEPV